MESCFLQMLGRYLPGFEPFLVYFFDFCHPLEVGFQRGNALGLVVSLFQFRLQ